jgi:PhnB protein
MPKLHAYLNFAGNTEEAFLFYKDAFGGEFTSLVRFKDMPMEGVVLPKDAEDKIMHVSLAIGTDNVLMGTDALESLGQTLVNGTDISLFVQVETRAKADRLFQALSKGGTIDIPMSQQPWGDYFGSVEDKFGMTWMLAYTQPKPE